MKITKSLKRDIRILLNHARADIDYGVGGSYANDDVDGVFQDEIEASKRAIAYLEIVARRE